MLGNFKDIVKRARSYRRFYENKKISEDTLRDLIDAARLTASAGNLQPLKFVISCQREKNNLIFPVLSWATYLKGWPGPKEGERPAAYIIILGDRNTSKWLEWDCGIAAQTIVLAATSKGLGCCMLLSVNKDTLRNNLKIPQAHEILLVLALGKPKEKVVIDDFKGDIKYYRDEKQTHHVPKKPLKELVLDL